MIVCSDIKNSMAAACMEEVLGELVETEIWFCLIFEKMQEKLTLADSVLRTEPEIKPVRSPGYDSIGSTDSIIGQLG